MFKGTIIVRGERRMRRGGREREGKGERASGGGGREKSIAGERECRGTLLPLSLLLSFRYQDWNVS